MLFREFDLGYMDLTINTIVYVLCYANNLLGSSKFVFCASKNNFNNIHFLYLIVTHSNQNTFYQIIVQLWESLFLREKPINLFDQDDIWIIP